MPELISSEKASEVLGIRPQTLACWRLYGRGPAFVKVGRLVKYDLKTLNEWILKRTVTTETAV